MSRSLSYLSFWVRLETRRSYFTVHFPLLPCDDFRSRSLIPSALSPCRRPFGFVLYSTLVALFVSRRSAIKCLCNPCSVSSYIWAINHPSLLFIVYVVFRTRKLWIIRDPKCLYQSIVVFALYLVSLLVYPLFFPFKFTFGLSNH